MKKPLLKLLLAFFIIGIAGTSNGQTVLLDEDFSSGTMPAGWSEDSAGATPFYTWAFNNPGNRIITGANFDNQYVIFDSDYYRSGNSQDAYLNLAPVNASAVSNVYLIMDEQFRSYSNGYHQIEVSIDGGASWNHIIAADTATTSIGYPNPAAHSTYDITSIAAGQSSVLVRFHMVGTYAWWWAIDNVKLVDALPPPPANDDCANAITLTMGATCSFTPFSLESATNSGSPGCNGAVADDDVWFSFVATDVSCIVKLISASYDHTVEIFDACGGTSIACLSPGTAGLASLFSGLTIGNTYYVAVYTDAAGVNDVANLNICLMIPPPPPANDDCASAVLLTENPNCISTSGTLDGATDGGITGCAGNAADDVWYSFVANDTVAAIEVNGHGQNNPVIEVFDGCGGTSLHCFNSTGTKSERGLARSLTIGNTYYFRIYSFGASLIDSAGFDVCVINVIFPANDDCGGAIEMIPGSTAPDCNLNTLAVTDLATASAPGPTCSTVNYQDDIWYYFVANNTDMTVQAFNLSASIIPTGIGFVLYDGSCGGTQLFCLNPPSPNTRYTFTGLNVGVTYFLRTFTANSGTTGSYNLCVYGGLFTDVKEASLSSEMRIYPNPSVGVLNISMAGLSTKTTIKIMDMIGNVIAEKIMLHTQKTEMDISSFANGIYFVKVENELGLKIQKIILNK